MVVLTAFVLSSGREVYNEPVASQGRLSPSMNVLITGASGFLGGYCAEAFIRQGHKVTALVRPTSRTDFLKSLGVQLQTGNPDLRGVNVVLHAAAKTEPLGPWHEFVAGTIDGTRQILDAACAAGVPHFIYISSRGIYERPPREGVIYDETHPYGHPHRWSYYARAKIAAEQIVRAESRIATTIFRPTWMYGPRDTMIFGRVVAALAARGVKWVGDGNSLINLIYVTDAANAIIRAATDPRTRNQIYNLADDEHSATQRQFLTRVTELLQLPAPTSTISYPAAYRLGFLSECIAHATGYRVRPPVTRHAVLLQGGYRRYSNEKLRKELGWQPQVDFETGLRATVEWYRSAFHTPHQP